MILTDREPRALSAHHLHRVLHYLIYIGDPEQPTQDTTIAESSGQHPRHAEDGGYRAQKGCEQYLLITSLPAHQAVPE